MFNVVGAIAWVVLFTMAGYWFGGLPAVKRNFQYVILAIIVISLIPVVVEFWRARRERKAAPEVCAPKN
jgi:membrane-associated protein